MKKFLRRTGLTALIVLCSLSLAALHIGLYIAAAEEGYVQNITLRETAAGELSITVSYRNIHHLYFEKKVFCAVYILDPGEETLYGDTGEEKLTADDGLGPYRIAICINLELGDSLYQKYPHRTVCEYRGASVPEGKYRIKISNLPSDIPESVIYIGSDFPLPVQEETLPPQFRPLGSFHIKSSEAGKNAGFAFSKQSCYCRSCCSVIPSKKSSIILSSFSHIGSVAQRPARAHRFGVPSRQATGAKEPSVSFRMLPTVYASGSRFSR